MHETSAWFHVSKPSFGSVGLSRTISNKADPRDEFHPKGKSLPVLVAASGLI
ncbi:hypothetical protein [Nitratireductor aestuarii]|uniref:hypothetical protein n=1 Tax=Nitratireductor aestuarii TaxID=1735103 RepID=UPI001664F4EC|nr:hypothetical protein [Nitratireductor aestuarii]